MKNLWIICCLLLAFSCGRPPVTGFEATKWESVDPVVDSITTLLEQSFYDVAPTESIAASIDRLYPHDRLLQTPAARERLARWHYWKSALFRKMAMNDSSRYHLNRAAEVVDSNKYYYTYRRIGTKLNSAEKGMAEWHLRRLLDDLNYYSEIGDTPTEGSVSILVAHVLSNSYQPDSALEYFRRADSLFNKLGLTNYIAKNRINEASCLRRMGRGEECMMLLDSLLNDTVVKSDFFAYNTVLRNTYIYTKDVSYLHRAHDRLMQRDSTLSANGVIEYLLSIYYLEHGKDTARFDYYASRAFSRIGKIDDLGNRASIMRVKSIQLEHAGKTDSAYLMLTRHVEATDTLDDLRQPAEIAKIRNMEIIARNEYDRRETRHFYVVRILILTFILIMVAAAGLFIIFRTRERHRREAQRLQMEKMRTELDIERYQKQVLAISLSMDETDRNLSEINDKIKELRNAGKVSTEDMRQIDTVIKSHISSREELRQFIEMFEKAHPHFLSNVKERYPDLSDSQMKLAMYVYLGMTNKQIATYLNIRTESVKQARWRLRVKMGLKTDDSLESTLRDLTD